MEQVPVMRSLNDGHLSQVKVSVRPELAKAFKAACDTNDVTQTSMISGFMETYSQTNICKNGYSPNLSTKRQRRAVVRRMLHMLERIKENEENYRDNIPENLQDSEVAVTADYCIAFIDEAYEALETAYHIY